MAGWLTSPVNFFRYYKWYEEEDIDPLPRFLLLQTTAGLRCLPTLRAYFSGVESILMIELPNTWINHALSLYLKTKGKKGKVALLIVSFAPSDNARELSLSR